MMVAPARAPRERRVPESGNEIGGDASLDVAIVKDSAVTATRRARLGADDNAVTHP